MVKELEKCFVFEGVAIEYDDDYIHSHRHLNITILPQTSI